MISHECKEVKMAQIAPELTGQLLALMHEQLAPSLPEASEDEIVCLIEAHNGISLTGYSLENLPLLIKGNISDHALNTPQHAAMREEYEETLSSETLGRIQALPEMQFAERVGNMTPTQALALLVAASLWLVTGDRGDIRSSLSQAFRVRAA